MKAEYLAALSKTPLFTGIGREELASFLICLNPSTQEYVKNEIIASEGSPFRGIGCVVAGEVAIQKENAAGERVILSVLKPGNLFGEMAAWSQKPRWPATVQALSDCAVMFIPPEKIASPCTRACRWHSAIIQNMLNILSEKALSLNRKVDYLAMKSMRGKLAAFFIEQQKQEGAALFRMPLNRNELADYLGVSRPSMSREMGRMRDEGIIDFHLATVKIKNMKALKQSLE